MDEVEKYMIAEIKEKKEREFYNLYWKHYIALEHKFLWTDSFVTIEKSNFATFSIEYEFLLQTICSEINVVCQCIMKEYAPDFTYKNIADFIKFAKKVNEPLKYNAIVLEMYDLLLFPWVDVEIDNNGRITKFPKWWIDNNDIKHNRITRKIVNGKMSVIENYKKANLENVLNALAALYNLETKCINKFRKKYSEIIENQNIDCDDLAFPEKSIFSLSLQPEERFHLDMQKIKNEMF